MEHLTIVPTFKGVGLYSVTFLHVGTMVNAPLCNSLDLFLSFSIVLLHSGILCLALRLSMPFGLWNELFTMPIQCLKCKLLLILSGATQEV